MTKKFKILLDDILDESSLFDQLIDAIWVGCWLKEQIYELLQVCHESAITERIIYFKLDPNHLAVQLNNRIVRGCHLVLLQSMHYSAYSLPKM